MNTFRVEHDDQPNAAVDRISSIITQFGLEIIEIEGGDGYIKYKIIKTDSDYENEV